MDVFNGVQRPIFYNFVFYKNFRLVCQPETIRYKKVNQFVLNTRTFYLENHNHEQVNFNGKLMTSTLQLIKIRTFKRAFENLKLIHIALEEDKDLL